MSQFKDWQKEIRVKLNSAWDESAKLEVASIFFPGYIELSYFLNMLYGIP